tara:strand:+ start:1605 stop:1760 length:156 start_codon:yes stop_codon:yes gene_type:complete
VHEQPRRHNRGVDHEKSSVTLLRNIFWPWIMTLGNVFSRPQLFIRWIAPQT